MATYYSTQMAAALAVPQTPLRPDELDGVVRIAYWSYRVTGAEANSDLVVLTAIPKDARFVAVFIANADAGGSMLAEIGTPNVNLSNGAPYQFGTAGTDWWIMPSLATRFSRDPAGGQVRLTLITPSALTVGAVLRGYFLYVTD